MVAKDTMLVHPKFGKVFILHMDANNYQIGVVVSQNGKPVAYFLKKNEHSTNEVWGNGQGTPCHHSRTVAF